MVPLAAAGTLRDILNLADSACYTAKEQGRNRVHIYQPDDRRIAGRVGDIHWAGTI